jgi:hypothetical protein
MNSFWSLDDFPELPTVVKVRTSVLTSSFPLVSDNIDDKSEDSLVGMYFRKGEKTEEWNFLFHF